MSQWSILNERMTGKWQIPLFALSSLMLAGAFMRLRPDPARFPLRDAIHYLDTTVAAGSFDRAIELGNSLLGDEEHSEADLAPVHLRLARAKYGDARDQRLESAGVGAQIVEHYARALARGLPFAADDFTRRGRAYEWQGRTRQAIENYEHAIEKGVSDRSDLRKHVISLWQGQPGVPPERLDEKVDVLLAELEERRLDLRLWAIELKLNLYEELDQLDKAMTLLVQNEDHFQASDQENHFRYLRALVLYKSGHYDAAEAYLRTVRNRLERDDEVHAMTGWLLGRTVMSDGGPQRPVEAMAFFTDVVTQHGSSPYAAASRIGMAEALGMLQRHDEAIDSYRVAIEELASLGNHWVVDREVLRTSIGVTAQAQRQQEHLAAALEYAQLAASLIDPAEVEQTTMILYQLVQIQTARAEELFAEADIARQGEDPRADSVLEEARATAAEAGATFVELARINTPHERRASESSWRGAEMYTKAGQLDRAAELYGAFATERPGHALVPRALLRVGQLNQRMGRIESAIKVYQECYRRFPHSLDGSRALVPLAQCYLAMGAEQDELAEKTLRVVLEDSGVFTPQAPEFGNALFTLGDVLNRRGMSEQGIATLEEALDRYPDDPRVWRARYLLADCYRRSGLALKDEMTQATFGGELEQMRAESTARLRKASELYRELITEYELRDPGGLTRLEQLYLRHAYLYEADCHFETQDYLAALRLYEDAAGTLKDNTAALAAYVQIINSHVFLGQPNEARAALARAKILVGAIPEEAFVQSVSPEGREDWQRYFDWLNESELF